MHVVSKTVSKTHWSNSTGKNSTQPKKTGDVLYAVLFCDGTSRHGVPENLTTG